MHSLLINDIIKRINLLFADLPEKPDLPVRQWVKAVNDGVDLPEFGIDQAVLLTRVMEAAYRPEAAQGAPMR